MTTIPTVPGDRPNGTIYDRTFWLAYSANLLLVTANALTFRFAEFVSYLGGTESITGQIVSAGLIGSLLSRLFLGQAIDGLGVRRIWMVSSVVFTTGCVLLTVIASLGWPIYLARMLFTIGLAAMFACSLYHIQSHAPVHRRTEIIGSLGSSGFVGMIMGTQFGDLIFNHIRDGRTLFIVLFGTTAVLGVTYLAIVAYLTRHDRPTRTALAPPVHRLIFRYWPGPVVLVALMMGLGFSVTTVFLTRYSTELHLGGIRAFFTGYAASAFVFRWLSRTWSQTISRHRLIILGMLGHIVGHLWLINVSSEWGLVPPSIFCGFGHAMLFPCVVSLGSEAFPEAYRGTGNTVTLGFVDLGIMLSSPLLGAIIDRHGFSTMFYTSAATMSAVTLLYAGLRFRVPDSASVPVIDQPDVPQSEEANEPTVPEGAFACSAEQSDA
jgi:MFS family permease